MSALQIEESVRAQKAMNYFLEGYNCSQAIVLAFEDLYDMDRETILKLSSSFGGGMGRLREVCGSVSGMFMVAGLLYGYDDPRAPTQKADHYVRIQELAEPFREQNGSIVCRELLGLKNKGADAPTPEARTAEYYKKRPCKELVGMSAVIMEEYIGTHPFR
ncbi:MAG: C-GCAxxG-C-C family protein [Hespellia sp.]|nr:C-GCAxxG-C-C family protein [Hespellia sp.]